MPEEVCMVVKKCVSKHKMHGWKMDRRDFLKRAFGLAGVGLTPTILQGRDGSGYDMTGCCNADT